VARGMERPVCEQEDHRRSMGTSLRVRRSRAARTAVLDPVLRVRRKGRRRRQRQGYRVMGRLRISDPEAGSILLDVLVGVFIVMVGFPMILGGMSVAGSLAVTQNIRVES